VDFVLSRTTFEAIAEDDEDFVDAFAPKDKTRRKRAEGLTSVLRTLFYKFSGFKTRDEIHLIDILSYLSFDKNQLRALARYLNKSKPAPHFAGLCSSAASGPDKALSQVKLRRWFWQRLQLELTLSEVLSVMNYVDSDCDGFIGQFQLEQFLSQRFSSLHHNLQDQLPITEITCTVTRAQHQAMLARPDANAWRHAFSWVSEEGKKQLCIWYKKMSEQAMQQQQQQQQQTCLEMPVVDVILTQGTHKEYGRGLTAAGYKRVSINLNPSLTSTVPAALNIANGSNSYNKWFIWYRHARSRAEEQTDAIYELACTAGRLSDPLNSIYIPPARNFEAVEEYRGTPSGDRGSSRKSRYSRCTLANLRRAGLDVLLWTRRKNLATATDVSEGRVGDRGGAKGALVSGGSKGSASAHMMRKELGMVVGERTSAKAKAFVNIKAMVRSQLRKAAVSISTVHGQLDIRSLYDKHCQYKGRSRGGSREEGMPKASMRNLLKEAEVPLLEGDFQMLWRQLTMGNMNGGRSKSSLAEMQFNDFLRLTDGEVDDVSEGVCLAIVEGMEYGADYRRFFEALDPSKKGVLEADTFRDVLIKLQVTLTAHELKAVMVRLGGEENGVQESEERKRKKLRQKRRKEARELEKEEKEEQSKNRKKAKEREKATKGGNEASKEGSKEKGKETGKGGGEAGSDDEEDASSNGAGSGVQVQLDFDMEDEFSDEDAAPNMELSHEAFYEFMQQRCYDASGPGSDVGDENGGAAGMVRRVMMAARALRQWALAQKSGAAKRSGGTDVQSAWELLQLARIELPGAPSTNHSGSGLLRRLAGGSSVQDGRDTGWGAIGRPMRTAATLAGLDGVDTRRMFDEFQRVEVRPLVSSDTRARKAEGQRDRADGAAGGKDSTGAEGGEEHPALAPRKPRFYPAMIQRGGVHKMCRAVEGGAMGSDKEAEADGAYPAGVFYCYDVQFDNTNLGVHGRDERVPAEYIRVPDAVRSREWAAPGADELDCILRSGLRPPVRLSNSELLILLAYIDPEAALAAGSGAGAGVEKLSYDGFHRFIEYANEKSSADMLARLRPALLGAGELSEDKEDTNAVDATYAASSVLRVLDPTGGGTIALPLLLRRMRRLLGQLKAGVQEASSMTPSELQMRDLLLLVHFVGAVGKRHSPDGTAPGGSDGGIVGGPASSSSAAAASSVSHYYTLPDVNVVKFCRAVWLSGGGNGSTSLKNQEHVGGMLLRAPTREDEFVTRRDFVNRHDSDDFVKVVQKLREGIREEAKAEDWTSSNRRLDYSVPFRVLDQDGDGVVHIDELQAMLQMLGVQEALSFLQFRELLSRFDTDGGGYVDFEEFRRFATGGVKDDDGYRWKLWDGDHLAKKDKKKDESRPLEVVIKGIQKELQKRSKLLGRKKASRSEADEDDPESGFDFQRTFFHLFDRDCDGYVSGGEFKRVLLATGMAGDIMASDINKLLEHFDKAPVDGKSKDKKDADKSAKPITYEEFCNFALYGNFSYNSSKARAIPEDFEAVKGSDGQFVSKIVARALAALINFAREQARFARFAGGDKGKYSFKKAFKAMDTDKSGSVDREDFSKLLKKSLEGAAKRGGELAELKVEELEEVLEYFDKDGDGDVDYEEFLDIMTEGEGLMTKRKRKEEGDDKDRGVAKSRGRGGRTTGDQVVDEVLLVLQRKLRSNAETKGGDNSGRWGWGGRPEGQLDLRRTFESFDRDGDGVVSGRELLDGLEQMGLVRMGERGSSGGGVATLSKMQRRALIEYFDKDGDGSVDYEEFCDFLLESDLKLAGSTHHLAGKVAEAGTGDSQLNRALRQVQQELRKRGRSKAGEGSGGSNYNETFDLSDTFRLLDRDGDGTISEIEFYEGLELLGLGGGRFTERQQRKLWRLLDANGDGSVQYHELSDFVLRGNFEDAIRKKGLAESALSIGNSSTGQSVRQQLLHELLHQRLLSQRHPLERNSSKRSVQLRKAERKRVEFMKVLTDKLTADEAKHEGRMRKPKFERVIRSMGASCMGKAQVEAVCKSFEADKTEAEGEYGWEDEEEKRIDYKKFVQWIEGGLERELQRVGEAAAKAQSETDSQGAFARKWGALLGGGYDGDDSIEEKAKPGSKSKYGGSVHFRGLGFPDFEEAAAMARLREGVRLAAERVRQAQGAAAVGIGRRGGVRGDSHFFGRMLQDCATDEETAKGRKPNLVTVAELRKCIESLDIRPKLSEKEIRAIVKGFREEESEDEKGGSSDSSDEESWREARSRRKELQSNVRYDLLMDKLDGRGRESVNGYWRHQQGEEDDEDSDGIGGDTDEEEEEARLREKRERERRRMQRRRERKWRSQGLMGKPDSDDEDGGANKSVRFHSSIELGVNETYGAYHGQNHDTTIKSEGINASFTRSYNINHRRERSGRLHTRTRARVMAALAARSSDGGALGVDDGATGLDTASLRRAFAEYDPRTSGLVSVEDFVSVVSALAPHARTLRANSADMDELLRAFVEPGTGSSRSRSYHNKRGGARGAVVPLVDYEAFCRAVSLDESELEEALNRVGQRMNELRSTGVDVAAEFAVFDTDTSGFVARLHFARVCEELGMPLNVTEMAGLMARYSTNAPDQPTLLHARGWQQINYRQFLRESGRPWQWRHDAGLGEGFSSTGRAAMGAGHDGAPYGWKGEAGRGGRRAGTFAAQSTMPPDLMHGPEPPTPRQLDAWLGHAPTPAELGHYRSVHRPPLLEEAGAIWRLTKDGRALDGSMRRYAGLQRDVHHAAAAHPAAAAGGEANGLGCDDDERTGDARYVRHRGGGHMSGGVIGVSAAGRAHGEIDGGNAWGTYRSAVSSAIRERRERLAVEENEKAQRKRERQERRGEGGGDQRDRRREEHDSNGSDGGEGRGGSGAQGRGRSRGGSSDEGPSRSRGGRGRGRGGSDSDSDSERLHRK
jgi:calcium-binding protein CML